MEPYDWYKQAKCIGNTGQRTCYVFRMNDIVAVSIFYILFC